MLDAIATIEPTLTRFYVGLSQTTLAEALGVTFQQVQKYEKGVNRVGAGRLTRIADALNARLHEEFKRRIKTQTVLPSAETAAMLFWALLASGQINMRKVDGWQTLATNLIDQPIDLAA